MEPEVHIVEKYVQLVMGCMTMSNIRLSGGKEIDLLALHPKTGDMYHIEVGVTISPGFKLRQIDTQTSDGRKHRRGLDTIFIRKFQHPIVVDKIVEIFGKRSYQRVLVVGAVEDNNVIESGRDQYGLEIWLIGDLLNSLRQVLGTKGYRDEILRTLQLLDILQ